MTEKYTVQNIIFFLPFPNFIAKPEKSGFPGVNSTSCVNSTPLQLRENTLTSIPNNSILLTYDLWTTVKLMGLPHIIEDTSSMTKL